MVIDKIGGAGLAVWLMTMLGRAIKAAPKNGPMTMASHIMGFPNTLYDLAFAGTVSNSVGEVQRPLRAQQLW